MDVRNNASGKRQGRSIYAILPHFPPDTVEPALVILMTVVREWQNPLN